MSQQGPPRVFRPLAPRTLLETPTTPGPVAEESKIRRASTACTECQRRRTKCSAQSSGTPCSECALHGRDCIIDEYADKRRKVARDRTEEHLTYYRGFLLQFLAAIRHGERADIDAIIDVIQSGAELKEIRMVIAQSLRHTKEVDGLEITIQDLKEPDGVSDGLSVNSSPDLKESDGISVEPSPDSNSKEPDGVPVTASPDAGLSAILNNDS